MAERRSAVLLSASPGISVVLVLLVPEPLCQVMTMGNEMALGAEVTLRMI